MKGEVFIATWLQEILDFKILQRRYHIPCEWQALHFKQILTWTSVNIFQQNLLRKLMIMSYKGQIKMCFYIVFFQVVHEMCVVNVDEQDMLLIKNC